MGIFDFLKDEDREHTTSRRGLKGGFDLSNFSNNAELIDWIEDNKVILLSEKEGLVVYTNDVKENFLQLYTSTSNVVDETLDEYVEITGGDLRNLLDEMEDISYLILNPSQENILIQREEILGTSRTSSPIFEDESYSESDDLEMTKIMKLPLDLDIQMDEKVFSSDAAEISGTPELITSEDEESEDLMASLDDESEELDDLDEEAPLPFPTDKKSSNEEADEEDGRFKVATSIPQSIIQNILKLSKEVQKFYLAEDAESDELFFMAGTTAEVKLDEELLGVTVLSQDGSDESFELENEKYLVYDSKRAKKLATTYSESAALAYFKEMSIVFPLSNEKTLAESTELTVFTDFSQIPDLFLNAFETFELASANRFRAFLDDNPEIEVIRLNPFTKSLLLRPEAFKSQKIELEENFGKTVTVTLDKGKGKQTLLSLLNILLDFKLANIAISKNEKKFTFEFASEKDVPIARQILKLKTKYQID